MNFDHYKDREVALAASLVNRELRSLSDLEDFVAEHRISDPGRLTRAALDEVRALQPRLRRIFETRDTAQAAAGVNALLREAGALPQLTDHDGEPWHLHVAPQDAALSSRLAAESAMGLSVVLRDEGVSRLKRCANDPCTDVFVDMSRNRSRRYCNPDSCGNRANVAAYRARQRATGSTG